MLFAVAELLVVSSVRNNASVNFRGYNCRAFVVNVMYTGVGPSVVIGRS